MSLTALPNQGSIVTPVQWQGATQKTTMQAAGYMLSGTIGRRPYSTAATITWVLPAADADAMLAEFEATNFNGVYSYTDDTRGAINIRLSGDYTHTEQRGEQLVNVSVGVYTV